MTEHTLKCWPQYFAGLWDGSKPFEVRRDDRGFAQGDTLHLLEWCPERRAYSGRSVVAKATSVYAHVPGLHNKHVVIGLDLIGAVRTAPRLDDLPAANVEAGGHGA